MNYGAVIINDFFNAHVFGGHKREGSAIYLEMGDFKAMNFRLHNYCIWTAPPLWKDM